MLPLSLRQAGRCAAQHEMGHFVAGKALGFRTGSVSLKIDLMGHTASAEVRLAEPIADLDALRSYLSRRIMVLMAGSIGETLDHAKHDKPVDRAAAQKILMVKGFGAEDDFSKCRELIRVLRNVTLLSTNPLDGAAVEAECAKIFEDLWAQAAALIERNATAVCCLASALVDDAVAGELRKMSEEFLNSLPGVREIACLVPAESPL